MISFVIICIVLISSRGVASDEQENEETTYQLDLCVQHDCESNRECEIEDGIPKCVCKPPFFGKDCSEEPSFEIDLCVLKECGSNRQCKMEDSNPKCECKLPYTGKDCSEVLEEITTVSTIKPEEDTEETTILSTTVETTSELTTEEGKEVMQIDYCFVNSCGEHGSCSPQEGGYRCVCEPPYSGDLCDEEFTELPTPSTSLEPEIPNSTLSTTPKSSNYTTTNTSMHTSDLEKTLSITTTQTHSTLTSSSTKASIDFCYENPCQNGGTCVTDPEGYKCFCSPLYSGENCDKDTKFTSTNSPTVEQTTTPGTTHETTMPSTTISTEETKTTSSTTIPTFETTMFTKNKPTQEPTTTTTTRGTTRESKSTTSSEETTIDHDLCISSPCLNNGSCISIDNSVRCNCTYPFSGKFCDTNLSEENQSSSNSIVYACTGSVGAIVFVFLIGFSVLWHLKRVKRRKKESYFHNADLSSIESENSRTYII